MDGEEFTRLVRDLLRVRDGTLLVPSDDRVHTIAGAIASGMIGQLVKQWGSGGSGG